MPKVSISDLERAAEWLRGYEPAPEEDGSDMLRVAEWIDAEIMRRQDKADIRAIAKQAGVTPSRARAALRNTQSAQS